MGMATLGRWQAVSEWKGLPATRLQHIRGRTREVGGQRYRGVRGDKEPTHEKRSRTVPFCLLVALRKTWHDPQAGLSF
jgi:hypothetical protein